MILHKGPCVRTPSLFFSFTPYAREPEESFVSSLPLQPWLGVKPIMPSANGFRPRANQSTKTQGGNPKRKRGRPPNPNARSGSSSSGGAGGGASGSSGLAAPGLSSAISAAAASGGASTSAGGAASARLPLPPAQRNNNAGMRGGPNNNHTNNNKSTASSGGGGNPSLAGKAVTAVTLGGKGFGGGQARAVDVLKNLQELDHRGIHVLQ